MAASLAWLTVEQAIERLRQKNEENNAEKQSALSERLRLNSTSPIREAPKAPPGVSLNANIIEAQKHEKDILPLKLLWFYNQVKNNGPWDYKQRASPKTELRNQYADFGNHHYGATGVAAGIPDWMLHRAAGLAQVIGGNRSAVYGGPLGRSPYGDDPWDQIMISQGMRTQRRHAR